MNPRRVIPISMIIAGITAMSSQVVFLRELLIIFYGNEISIGIVLAAWLLWGAAGSILISNLFSRIKDPAIVFSFLQASLAIALPATLIAIRFSKGLLGILPGEIIGYGPMTIISFGALSVSCVVFGAVFSVSCKAYSLVPGVPPKKALSRIYILEAIGALIGGAFATYLAIRYLDSFNFILILGAFNLLSAIALLHVSEFKRSKKSISFIFVTLLLAAGLFLTMGTSEKLNRLTKEKLWEPYVLLESRNTIYGNITVTQNGPQISFFENGLHLYTVTDRLSAEEVVHFALLEHPDPKTVLLIGGGMGGALAEILKHPVEKVDYIELDPEIIKISREYLPETYADVVDDARVSVINVDGRLFVKNTPNEYDCIIINLGDPYTAQVNRFYTVQFFGELKRILSEGAIGSFVLTSSANYLSKELSDYLGSIYKSLEYVFPEIMLIPGDSMHFLFSPTSDVFSFDASLLESRLAERGVDVQYVREYYIFDKLSLERRKSAEKVLRNNKDLILNTDFRPISYFYATVFWGTQLDDSGIENIIKMISPELVWKIAVAICLILLLLGGASRKVPYRVVLLSVMTTGFAEINFQVTTILSFQEIYGYLFYKIGILMASFMAGLALGGWFIGRKLSILKNDMSVFLLTQIAICIYPLILPPIFGYFSSTNVTAAHWMGANIVFPILPAIAGFIGGVQFPLAGKIYYDHRPDIGKTSGVTYGMDLLGASLGALVSSAFIVPLLGIYQACLLVSIVNITVLAAIFIVFSRGD